MFEDAFDIAGGTATLALAALFMAVFLAILAIAALVAPSDPLRRRLAGHMQRPTKQRRRGDGQSLRAETQSVDRAQLPHEPHDALRDNWRKFIRLYSGARLREAGLGGGYALRVYVLAQILLAVAAPAAVIALAPAALAGPVAWHPVLLLVGLVCAGFCLPGMWLRRRIERRRRAIANGFPDALDMLLVCVEAGLGLDAALARVGGQIAPAHPLLSAEIAQVSLELRAGKSREDALRNLARRIGLPEVTSFVTLMVQSETLGAGVGQTLRAHAEDLRAGRMLRAEEKAHKLPVKLTVPLVFCILPAMLTAVLLPGMLTIVRDILPNLGR